MIENGYCVEFDCIIAFYTIVNVPVINSTGLADNVLSEKFLKDKVQ